MITVLAVAAMLVAPPGFYEAKALEPAASYVAGKPIAVRCAKTPATWNGYLIATYGVASDANGSAPYGGTEIYLSPAACVNLASLRRPFFYAGLAPSILALTHEAIHARGERDEGATDCDAVHEMPRVAVLFFGVKPGGQLRALMAAAWAARAKESALYRSAC